MSRLVVLRRARIRELGIDTTVKSSQGIFRSFSPSWNMVMGHKAGRVSDEEYTAAYLVILSQVPKTAWRALWSYGIQNGGVTPLLCYCPVEKPFCHNQILMDYAVEHWPKAFCREEDQKPIVFTKECPRWGFLSNFSPHGFSVDGVYYQTVEHYFQSGKTYDPTDFYRIKEARTPHAARAVGRRVALRSDWNARRLVVMKEALYAKFTQNPDIRLLLITSHPRELVEQASWDEYWGSGRLGHGKNMLGKMLMELRTELITSSAPVER